MTGRSSFSSLLRVPVLAAAIIAAPLALLAVPHATFSLDWTNNLWMADYARAYFNSHWQMPATYDVMNHVGIPQPIFYGPLLYPWLGLMSEPFGVVAGVRLACLVVWTLQFALAYRLSRAVGAAVGHALAAASIVSWSVYPLTNLYNRGALAEFFATTFLLCAVAAGGLALVEVRRSRRAGFALLSGVCAAMAIGSHGPTALVGGLLLLIFALAAIPLRLGTKQHGGIRRLGVMILLAIGVGLAVSPWVYAVASNLGRLAIESPDYKYYPYAGIWQRFDSIDSWWARLKPLPLVDRWTVEKYPEWLTPHLDAQWNFPLALLAAWNAALVLAGRRDERIYRAVRPLMVWAALACLGLLALSVSAPMQAALPMWVGGIIQFPYRLVSHVNIAAFVLLIAAMAARGPQLLPGGLELADRAMLTAALLIAACGLIIKLDHAASVMVTPDMWATQTSESLLRTLPSTFVGLEDYTVKVENLHPGVAETVANDLPVGRGPEGSALSSDMETPSWEVAATSIMNFPWNRVVLDGKPIPFEFVEHGTSQQIISVPPGRHTLGFRFEPDEIWVALRWISWITLAAGVIGSAGWFLSSIRLGE
jgi:hypothetical protein